MGVIYEISHVTRYAYANPVTLSEHRAMFLPRVGHGGRLLRYALNTSVPSKIRWITDALSNDVALIEFQAPTRELVVSYELKGVHYGMERIEPLLLDARAKCFPVQ
jgi:transglutaminase-like putative cysteine protease